MADEYGYEKNNPRHQESYWEDRTDPRFQDEKNFRFTKPCYAAIDRQIAAEHHERTQVNQNPGTGQGQGSGSGTAGGGGGAKK